MANDKLVHKPKGMWKINTPKISTLYYYWMKREKAHEKIKKANKRILKAYRQNFEEATTTIRRIPR